MTTADKNKAGAAPQEPTETTRSEVAGGILLPSDRVNSLLDAWDHEDMRENASSPPDGNVVDRLQDANASLRQQMREFQLIAKLNIDTALDEVFRPVASYLTREQREEYDRVSGSQRAYELGCLVTSVLSDRSRPVEGRHRSMWEQVMEWMRPTRDSIEKALGLILTAYERSEKPYVSKDDVAELSVHTRFSLDGVLSVVGMTPVECSIREPLKFATAMQGIVSGTVASKEFATHLYDRLHEAADVNYTVDCALLANVAEAMAPSLQPDVQEVFGQVVAQLKGRGKYHGPIDTNLLGQLLYYGRRKDS